MKFKVGQEVWVLEMFHYNGYLSSKTSKVKIMSINQIYNRYIFYNNFSRDETSVYATEKELLNSNDGFNFFVSSKNCWKKDLKYIEREEKLKRILE